MKIKRQLLIDRYLARPAAFLLNFIVRIVGFILRPDHDLSRQFKCFAVSKYKGMGSIIQATPMLKTLNENYPEARILFITTKSLKPLVDQISIIDEVIILDDSSILSIIRSVPGFVFRLIRAKIDVFFDLEIYSDASSFLTTLSMAKNRIGYYLRSSQFRMGIYTHMMYFNPRLPVSACYLQMCRLLPLKKEINSLFEFGNKRQESYALPFESPVEYIIINPNASNLRKERMWPADRFVDFIKGVRNAYQSLPILLIGSSGETAYVDSLFNDMKEIKDLHNLAGKTTILELIEIIKNAKLMITNDTGPMHIAFACGTPCVALFGPCHPQQYGLTSGHKIIYKNLYCSPCVHEFEEAPCKGNNMCMKQIQTAEVFQAFESLYLKRDETGTEILPVYLVDQEGLPGMVKRS